MRARTVIVRRPAITIPSIPLSLEDTLAAVGITPRAKAKPHGHPGLLRRWFAFESTPLAVANVVASVALLTVAMTMTALGMQIAVALGLAPVIFAVLNDGLPYLAIALFVSAALKAGHAYFDRKMRRSSRIIGYLLALLLTIAGLWIGTMLGFANIVPAMFEPVLWLAGGENAAKVDLFNKTALAYFEPALIGGIGALLVAKQFKTGTTRRAPMSRKRVALAGITLSLCVSIVSAAAAYRHYTGADAREGLSFAIGGDALSGRDQAYASLFAPGVPCHVSSLYGYRTDPVDRAQTKLHQGVDIAVKEGTPVHAMSDGRVLFAESDAGLGNFVALQTKGPTIVNGHMQTLLVSAGQEVRQGDVIGLAGNTGKSTGPHVHLQLCPGGHMNRGGGFVCGGSTNPYNNWPTLAALARMTCVDGPKTF